MKRLMPLLLLTVALAAEEERPRVLMLFSNDRMLPANQEMELGIRSAIDDRQVEFFGEFLDAVRFPGPEQWDNMQRFLTERHQAKPPAAYICIGPQALEFLAQRRNSLFPDVPVVISGVTPPQLASLPSLEGIAGRPMDWTIRPLLEYLPQIRPQIQRILIVTGAAEFDALRQAEAKAQIEPYQQKFKFEFSHSSPRFPSPMKTRSSSARQTSCLPEPCKAPTTASVRWCQRMVISHTSKSIPTSACSTPPVCRKSGNGSRKWKRWPN